MTQIILVENSNGHFIHQQNTVQVRYIGIIEYHPPLIHRINLKMNQLIFMVPLAVVYQQYPLTLYLNVQSIQHINIIYKRDLFLLVLLVVWTIRVVIQAIITIPIIKKGYKKKNDTFAQKIHKMFF